jgi:hypothetical protein|tara:strand:- start:52 stop:612 length:561 start_codon:yes stop_codon:yes gene_type:complete
MGRVIDALIAYRVLKILVTPFNRTQAYKMGIIDDKGKVLIKSKDLFKQFSNSQALAQARKSYTLLIRFVFNLKRLLGKVGIRGPIGSAAAAAIAFFKEENDSNKELEKLVYKQLKEHGFEFEVNENYGEPLRHGTYRVKNNITNLEGDIVINIDEEVIFEGITDTILGYDVFKYRNVYLTTEDLYV